MSSFSLVLPCYNEEANIRRTINDVFTWLNAKEFDGEVVAVDDGSTDLTGDILEELAKQHPQLVVVHHKENRGYASAIITGCDEATKDIIGFMDSDGQFKAEDFDHLLAHIDQYDFVVGRRRKRADPIVRTVNALLYGTLVRIALGVKIRDVNCGMKIYRQKIWPVIRPKYATGALFNAEVFLRAKENGIVWHQVAVPHYPRVAGNQTGARPSVILKMFRDLFTLKGKHRHEVANRVVVQSA